MKLGILYRFLKKSIQRIRHTIELKKYDKFTIAEYFRKQGAHILPNFTIGENSTVGAGSVAISEAPPNCIVMGVPARKSGSSDKYKEKCIENWKVQRPPDFHLDSLQHY